MDAFIFKSEKKQKLLSVGTKANENLKKKVFGWESSLYAGKKVNKN